MGHASLAGAVLASVIAAVYPASALAATVIEAGSSVAGVWTPEASPYLVRGDAGLIEVRAGSELRIEAGTTVQFADASVRIRLSVEGRLTISGTRAAPVTLEAESSAGEQVWEGIVATSGATVSITGAILRHANNGLMINGQASIGPITSSTFEGCSTGVLLLGGSVGFDASTFAKNGTGIQIIGGEVTVTNSIFSGARLNGIAANGGTLRAVNCTFDHNYIAVYARGTVEVRNSILSNNDRALEVDGSPNLTIGSSTFWTNKSNLFQSGSSSAVVPGVANHNLDPLYVGPTDLRLSAASPCIDSGFAAGAPDHDFAFVARPQEGDLIPDTDGSTFDRGAYEFVADGPEGGGAGGSGGAGGEGSSDGAGTGNAGGSGGADNETGGRGGSVSSGGSEALGGSAGRMGNGGVGAESSGGARPSASGGSGASGESGKTGGAGSGSGGGSTGSGGASSGGVAGASGNSGSDSCCDCRAVGPKPRNSGALISAFALAALAGYRRRQKRQ